MHKSLLRLTIGTMLAIGCGGSSPGSLSSGGTGGATTSLGSGGSGDNGGGGASGSAGGCSVPCLNDAANLIDNCAPSGSCTEQVSSSGSTMGAVACYSNGVKMSMSMAVPSDPTSSSLSMTATFKKGSSVCYTMVVGTDATGSATTMTIKNPSGAVVATIATSSAGTDTVTCPGQAPAPIDPACNQASDSVNGASGAASSSCTTGTCSF